MMALLKEELASFLFATQFLTRVPIPSSIGFSEARFAGSVKYYPWVGLCIGGGAGCLYIALSALFAPLLAALLAIAITIFVTGAFHEDGLADMADGLGGGATREAALEIMKDSRLGTYGTLALGICVAAATIALADLPPVAGAAALFAAHSMSRLSSIIVIATSTYVRDHGTGKPVANAVSGSDLLIALASLIPALLWLSVTGGVALALVAVMGSVIGHAIARILAERKLSGYTGDTLGGVQQLSFVGILLGCSAWL
ncbi:MAG: adenosylcobinamide-GDP ribazoletransferase [Pseudomonadota bacterium]